MKFMRRLTSYFRQATRCHALLVGACVLGCASSVMAQAVQPAAAVVQPAAAVSNTMAAVASTPDEIYLNEVELSLAGTIVSGDKGAFRQRKQVPAGQVLGGVESLHYEDALSKEAKLTLDGRGIVNNHDYNLDLNIVNPEVGFFKAGYKEFRTWYDGSGGYLPNTGIWIAPTDDSLAVDRGNFAIEAGLTKPDVPQLTLKYEHQFRNGTKDTTSWSDETTKGLSRYIVPNTLNIDEKRDIVSADGKHTIGNTDLGLGLRYEKDSQDDSSDVVRGTLTKNQRYVKTEQKEDTDIVNAHAFTDTALNKKVRFTTGYLVDWLKTDIGGTRIFGSDYDAAFDPKFSKRQYHDEGYYNLTGGSTEKQYVMNANLMITPVDSLSITPSARIEKRNRDGDSRFAESAVGASPKFTTAVDDLQAFNQRGIVEASQQLEARYTGIRNWVLYLAGDWTEGDGDYSHHTEEYATKEIIDALVGAEDTQFVQKYTAGATWYPLKRLNFASQYYHKIKDNDYENYSLMSKLKSDTDDVNVRATWRPLNSVTLVGRYDLQLSTVDQATAKDKSDYESADIKRHIIGGTLTLTPIASVYLQSGLNYAIDRMDTPAEDVTGAGANLVTQSRNDYWNFTQIVGLALCEKTDLQVQYSYYRASDFMDNSSSSTAYGAGEYENTVSATLKHALSERLQASLKYGYTMLRDEASGGNNDYDAHLIMASTKYRF